MKNEFEGHSPKALQKTARTIAVGLLFFSATSLIDARTVSAEEIHNGNASQIAPEIQVTVKNISEILMKLEKGRFRFGRQVAPQAPKETGVCIGRYQMGDGYYGFIQNRDTGTTTMCKVD